MFIFREKIQINCVYLCQNEKKKKKKNLATAWCIMLAICRSTKI